MKPQKYRKRPVEVEAMQFKGGEGSGFDVVKWILSNAGRASYETTAMDTVTGLIPIKTLEGTMYAAPGDYIIRGVQGEFYPCKPHIFEQTYDIVVPDPDPVMVCDENRAILERAWDDGDKTVVLLAHPNDATWFVGMWDNLEICEGVEHGGTLYTIVYLSGGGLVSVILGGGLLDNDAGVTFSSVPEAKAYIQGLTAK